MLWRPEDSVTDALRDDIVVAGPGSNLTIPGIIVSEIVQALAALSHVTRIEVDLRANENTGLHRAPSLAVAHNEQGDGNISRYRAADGARLRGKTFKDLIGSNVAMAIAYVWPGIDNEWIPQFLSVAKNAGASTAVICASLPHAGTVSFRALAPLMADADRVYVGDIVDATTLATAFGSRGTVVEVHRALSLKGRGGRHGSHQITAFLPKDNTQSLSAVLAAFDAIPEAWIGDYQLRLVMRFSDEAAPDLVRKSHYAGHVELLGADISSKELEDLCATSSALSVAEPREDSRAFSSAVRSGAATVALMTSTLPRVGQGYVGGLLADIHRPASINVALQHALRLEELRFPSPNAWDELARRLRPASQTAYDLKSYQHVAND